MAVRWRCLAVLALVVTACSTEPLDLAEFPPDGVLDCTDDSSWGIQADLNPNAFGSATAKEAVSDALFPYLQSSGELRETSLNEPTLGSLLNNQNREVVIVLVSEAAPGNWQLSTVSGCNGYELF